MTGEKGPARRAAGSEKRHGKGKEDQFSDSKVEKHFYVLTTGRKSEQGLKPWQGVWIDSMENRKPLNN